jgi:hypothetical protein
MKRSYTPALAVGIGAVARLAPSGRASSSRLGFKAQMDSHGKFAICQNYFSPSLENNH